MDMDMDEAAAAAVAVQQIDDLMQLGLLHDYELTLNNPSQGFYGVIFHYDGDRDISVHRNNIVTTYPMFYFNSIMPFHYAYKLPSDHTLGCFFTSRSSLTRDDIDIKVDGVSLPLKYIIPRENPINEEALIRWFELNRYEESEQPVPATLEFTECEPFHCDICITNEKTHRAVMNCTHTMCKDCATIWFTTRNTCPFCRAIQ